LFHAETEGYILGIRGYDFNEFGEHLSRKAEENLCQAVDFIAAALKKKDFSEILK